MRSRVGSDNARNDFIQLAIRGAKELAEHGGDQINLKRVLARRKEQAQIFFQPRLPAVSTAFYGPGRSWQAFGHLLLRILPPLVRADLGAGEGLLSELLARPLQKGDCRGQTRKKSSRSGAAKAKKNGLKNLEFRQGDLQNPPIEAGSVDLVILSQALASRRGPGGGIGQRGEIIKTARTDFVA